MNGRNNLDELLAVLEDIRKKDYPDIPSEIIKEIVVTQYENQDKRLEARAKTNDIVNSFLTSATSEEDR